MSDHAFPSAADTPKRGRTAGLLLTLILLALLAGAGYLGWLGWQKLEATRGTMESEDALIQRMGRQLRALERDNEQLAQRLGDAEVASRRLGSTVEGLGGAQQTQAQNIARIDETLTGSRARFQLAAVEELLQLAADRVALYRDRDTAVQALQMADERIAAMGDSRLLKLREAITIDRQALQAVAVPDVSGAALTLGGLINREKQWPLILRTATATNATAASPAVTASSLPAQSWQARAWAGFKQALDSVVRIRREQRPIEPLLAPEQEALVHHMTLMRLEAARLALLQAEPAALRDALASAKSWLMLYYQPDDAGVHAAIAELDRLGQVPVNTALPVPTQGLLSLRQLLKGAAPKP